MKPTTPGSHQKKSRLKSINPTFAHETASLMSADSWVKIDRFEKFKTMVVCLDLMMEKK